MLNKTNRIILFWKRLHTLCNTQTREHKQYIVRPFPNLILDATDVVQHDVDRLFLGGLWNVYVNLLLLYAFESKC